MPGSILIVDDEVRLGRALQRTLELDGHEAVFVGDPERALETLRARPFDVLLTDLVMPGMNGIEVLRRARRIRPSCEVVLMTAFATVQTARDALKQGALDYVTKPFSARTDLAPLIREIVEGGDCECEVASEESGPVAGVEGVIGRSPAMRALVEKLPRIARSESSVLLRGESGTGKEVLANAIHQLSPRRERPIVKVNCAALTESLLEAELFGVARGAYTGAERDRIGLFQAADGGTLLLDEVGELPVAIQAKLLRVLQDGEFHRVGDSRGPVRVDVRLVAATNRDLERAVDDGSFRKDLYYRLNVVPVEVPPLRERMEDLGPLVEAFLARYGKGRDVAISKAAQDALESYPWPGNVRELENAVEHGLVLGDGATVHLSDLPAAVQEARRRAAYGEDDDGADDTLESIEKRCILQALARTRFHRTRAAHLLGITRRTLGYRIRKYGLEGELERLRRQGEPRPVLAAEARRSAV